MANTTERLARHELSVLMCERATLKREFDALKVESDRLEYEYYCTYESDDAILEQWLDMRERADQAWSKIRANIARQNELRTFLRAY